MNYKPLYSIQRESVSFIHKYPDIISSDFADQSPAEHKPPLPEYNPFEQPTDSDIPKPHISLPAAVPSPSQPEAEPQNPVPMQDSVQTSPPEVRPTPLNAQEINTNTPNIDEFIPSTPTPLALNSPPPNAAALSAPGAAAPSGFKLNAAAPAPNSVLHKSGSETGASPSRTIPDADAWKSYARMLSAHFKQKKYYPEMARRLKLTGTVTVSVTLYRDGTLADASIKTSSGQSILDKAALQSVKLAIPAPPFPDAASEKKKTFIIPYNYTLQ